LLTKHQNVFFSKSKGDLGNTDLVQNKINTGSAVPIRQSLRRLPYGKRQTEKETIFRMLLCNSLAMIAKFVSHISCNMSKYQESLLICLGVFGLGQS
jgi:hypothetical protein